MRKLRDTLGINRRLLLSTTRLFVVVMPLVLGLTNVLPSRGQSPAQNTPSVAPVYEFEAASIKPVVDCSGSFSPGYTVDGYRAECVTVRYLIRAAYDVKDYGLLGVPDWLNTQLYDVEAKMDASVVDALGKLTPDQLKLARQQMLQTLLAERFNLKIHRETKEEPVYLLAIGKNGPKLQDAKPGDTNTFPGADGSAVRGQIQLGPGSGGGHKDRAHTVSMSLFEQYLSAVLGRPVLDRTGLTGAYDFTLEWVSDLAQTAAAPGADGVAAPPLDAAPPLMKALEEQLGLKLSSAKENVDVIVIDHVERPSGN